MPYITQHRYTWSIVFGSLGFNDNSSSYPVEMVLSVKTLSCLGNSLLHLLIYELTQSYGQL